MRKIQATMARTLAAALVLGLAASAGVMGQTTFPPSRCDSAEPAVGTRSAEHPSELQSLMRSSYAVFCSHNKHKTITTEAVHPPPTTRTNKRYKGYTSVNITI